MNGLYPEDLTNERCNENSYKKAHLKLRFASKICLKNARNASNSSQFFYNENGAFNYGKLQELYYIEIFDNVVDDAHSKNIPASKNTEIMLRLTRPSDPFFLYHCTLGEDVFLKMQKEQNLLFGFSQFIVKFSELLQESCVLVDSNFSKACATQNIAENYTEERHKHDSLSKANGSSFTHYVTRIDWVNSSSLALCVDEENSYRSLKIMQLIFKKASSDDIRVHVNVQFRKIIDEKQSITCELENAKAKRDEISAASKQKEAQTYKKYVSKCEEYEELWKDSLESTKKIADLKISIKDLTEQKELLMAENSALLNSKQEEKRIRNQKQSEIDAHLAEKTAKDGTITELQGDLKKANEIIVKLQTEFAKITGSFKSLQATQKSHEQKECSLETQLEILQEALKEKDRLQQDLSEAQTTISKLNGCIYQLEAESSHQMKILDFMHKQNPQRVPPEPMSSKHRKVSEKDDFSSLIISSSHFTSDELNAGSILKSPVSRHVVV